MNRMHEFPSRVTTTGSPFVPCSARKTKVSGRNRTRERGIVYQILEYRYREQKSQLFPSNPLQPLRNFLETSLSKHCSHYFASIYANIIERNEEKFEIFPIYFSLSNWILKKHLSICWNVSTCIAHRSENSINFHQVSTYRQSLLSLTLTLPQTIEAVTRSENMGSSSVRNFSIEYFAEEDRSGRFDSRRPNYTTSVESISDSPHHFNLQSHLSF